ncbi:MAG: hypothetical protein RI958_85 [Actinomycetota bacterium]|jgi:hypothetical protein
MPGSARHRRSSGLATCGYLGDRNRTPVDDGMVIHRSTAVSFLPCGRRWMSVCVPISPLRWDDAELSTIHSAYYNYQSIHHHLMKKGTL